MPGNPYFLAELPISCQGPSFDWQQTKSSGRVPNRGQIWIRSLPLPSVPGKGLAAAKVREPDRLATF